MRDHHRYHVHMGFIRETKKTWVRDDAQKAWDDGLTVFVAQLNAPFTGSSHGSGSGGIRDWAEMIQEVESIGWHLNQWSLVNHERDMYAVPLFRR